MTAGEALRLDLIAAGALRPDGDLPRTRSAGPVLRLDARGRGMAARRLRGQPADDLLLPEHERARDADYWPREWARRRGAA